MGYVENMNSIYTDHNKLLLWIASQYVRNQQDAEEIVQSVYEKAWSRAEETFSYPREALKNLFCKMTRNAAISLYRKKKLHSEIPFDGVENLLFYEESSRVSEIESYLADLKQREKRILILRYFYGYSVRETAEKLRLTDSSVQKAASHAIQKIRAKNRL